MAIARKAKAFHALECKVTVARKTVVRAMSRYEKAVKTLEMLMERRKETGE